VPERKMGAGLVRGGNEVRRALERVILTFEL